MKNTDREWLETDGLGGFSSGTISGRRTRRYHALLLTAQGPSNSRYVLVNGIEAYVQTSSGTAALSSHQYLPNIVYPHGDQFIQDFQSDPWPAWDFQLEDGTQIRQEFFVPRESSTIVLRWSLVNPSKQTVNLTMRPLLSGRDYHSLHQENSSFRFDHTGEGKRIEWTPYSDVPSTTAIFNGTYTKDPSWYRQFYYIMEDERGLDCSEDLASPGVFCFELNRAPAVCILTAGGPDTLSTRPGETAEEVATRLERSERVRRMKFPSRLHRSADQYLVRRRKRDTIIAGYPWFTDWGRDTFISIRGLCLATNRLEEAGKILHDWVGIISKGMVPNRFPDDSAEPEFNSVDASLWYVVAVHDYLEAMKKAGQDVPPSVRNQLQSAVGEILSGYSQGTRYQIGADSDGLIKAGIPEKTQLTWMDAIVDGWIVTARVGKPVEIQALWINALWFGSQFDSRWRDLLKKATVSFRKRFWNEERACLYDVVDVDHQPGTTDDTFRPNQILAVGGLPLNLLEMDQARQVVANVEKRLVSPLGVRTLEPGAQDYHAHYTGDLRMRDAAYHQGTAWPWLMGPFVEAWLRVNAKTEGSRSVARARFVQPLIDHMEDAGIGHITEIADGDVTSTPQGRRQIPRGCPAQAWSTGELLRILEVLLSSENSEQKEETSSRSRT